MRQPRLYTILLVVSLVILVLPVGGIGFLRLYESALVRQTESELIGQGAFVAAAYKSALIRAGQKLTGFAAASYGTELPPPNPAPSKLEQRFLLRSAKLDFAVDPIYPPPGSPTIGEPADRLASGAGREIAALMREAQSTTLAAIRVVDHRGTVVASTGDELGLSLAKREEIAHALRGEYVSMLRERVSDEPVPELGSVSRRTGVRVFVAVPIVWGERVYGAVLLARTPASISQTLWRKRGPILGGIAFVVMLAVIVALLTALTIVRPLKAVVRQTQRAVRGEKGAVTPLARPGTREVGQLSQAVAKLARTLEDRADYIRDFAANVSHEFKTPLTAIHGAVELLREHGNTMSEQERRRFLENLEADTLRLDRLVRRLLELARADVLQPGGQTARITPLLERVAYRYTSEGLRVTLDNESGDAVVAMSEETLESILHNLLDNTRQHGGPDVQVTLRVVPDEDRKGLRLVLSDNGPGVSAANAGRVFQPFFTTARAHGGTGLGLAVVRSLLAAHGGSIALLPGKGAVFEVRLPLAASVKVV